MIKTDNKNKDWLFSSAPIPRAIITMALPAIFSQIVVLIYNMADTFYLGLSENAYMVAGVSLILPVFNITLSLASLCGVGAGTQISRLLGMHEESRASRVCSFSIWLALVLSLSFSVLLFVFQDPLLRFLGASDNTLLYAGQYLFWVLILGSLPTVLSNVMATLLRSVGYSAQAGFGITMGGLLNIALDPLFMFVLLPAGNEVLGVAMATLLSNAIVLVYFLIQLGRLASSTVLSLRPQALPEREEILAVFTIGLPSSIATLLFDLDYAIIGRLMAGYGDYALAASGIVLKIERLPLNVGIGICQGMLPILAYNMAAADFGRARRAIRFSLVFGLVFAAISVLAYELFAPFLVELFIRHEQTLAYGIDFLRIRALATPLMFISFFSVYVFQGFNKGMVALFLGVMRWAVFNIPMLFVLEHFLGLMGIVWAQSAGDVLSVLLCALTYFIASKNVFVSGKTEKAGNTA